VDVLHVISGELTLRMTQQSYDLEAGDTLSFPGREPHSWENFTDHPVEVLWILVPAASGSSPG
jgi:quercetin dioxygenase-like cupin family protein